MNQRILMLGVVVACIAWGATSARAVNLEDDPGLTITASVGDLGPANGVEKLIDDDPATEWISETSVGTGGSATLTFTWDHPVPIKRVEVTHNFYPPDQYRIETWNGSAWVEHVQFQYGSAQSTDLAQNGAMPVDFPAQTDRLRIVIDFAHSANYPRLAEVTVSDTLADVPDNLEDVFGLTVVSGSGNLGGYPVTNLIDNDTNTEWVASLSTGIGGPDTVTFTWPSPVHIEYVLINMGYYNLFEYTVETWNGSSWVVHDGVVDDTTTPYIVKVHKNGAMALDFPDQTTQLRINIQAANQDNYARFAEITILSAAPAEPSRYEDYDLSTVNTFQFHRLNQQTPFVDLNQDGLIDLVAPNGAGARLFFQQANPTEQFSADTNDPTMTALLGNNMDNNVTGFYIGDFGNDGIADVAYLGAYSNNMLPANVKFHNGLGSGEPLPEPTSEFELGNGVIFVYYTAVGDVNGDGRLDLAFRPNPNHAMKVLIATQQGNGTFAITSKLNAGTEEGAVLLYDVDDDGKDDLLTVNGNNRVDLFLTTHIPWVNDDAGTTKTASYTVSGLGAGAVDLDVGDVNGDGGLDLVVSGGTKLSVWTDQSKLWQPSASSIQPDLSFDAGESVVGLEVIDLDVDGRDDILVGTTTGRVLLFLARNADPLFENTPDQIYGVNAFSNVGDVIVQDLDGDLAYDLIAYEDVTGAMTVWMDLEESGSVPQPPTHARHWAIVE